MTAPEFHDTNAARKWLEAHKEPHPFHAYVKLGSWITAPAGGDVMVVGRYGARELCVMIHGEDVPELVGGSGGR